MNPEDDYVADFVKGISRLEVVKAKSIMRPVDEFIQKNRAIPKDAIKMNENDDLSSLIEHSVAEDKPIVICDKKGSELGVISQKELLISIIEGQDE